MKREVNKQMAHEMLIGKKCTLVRIYCDGNSGYDESKFDLACPGSMSDIARHAEILKEGARVLFYETEDWEAEGTIHFDKEKQRWFGVPDFSTLRHLR